MLVVTSGANKDSRPLIIPQEIDEETAREIPGAGCTWYPDEQLLSNEVVWLSRSAYWTMRDASVWSTCPRL